MFAQKACKLTRRRPTPIPPQGSKNVWASSRRSVGDRDFHAKDANIKDSFKRVVTLKRIVHVGATSYTEDLKTRTMGNARVGETFNGAYARPKNVPGATKYTWILTIEGEDPNAKNNTFTKVQKVTKID